MMNKQRWRFVLAGPVVFIAAIAVMSGAAVWMPSGVAGVNNIVLPLALFPAIWAVLFFYVCLTENLKRAGLITGLLLIANVVLVVVDVMIQRGIV
ncbi:Uncharacterised protein [BD1-7 clade bacterium]|uniref:Uncharacterized protein n=1 Tax=BD1-7 clade bacterium TaxID=2029982 RepID=A0A5S9PX75_9GAMM|nr:Uncharacterised protein [BD1-7 clade bacterium]CAA0113188.1 Uncharacterised protein [BD1-7 clade bacterium]